MVESAALAMSRGVVADVVATSSDRDAALAVADWKKLRRSRDDASLLLLGSFAANNTDDLCDDLADDTLRVVLVQANALPTTIASNKTACFIILLDFAAVNPG